VERRAEIECSLGETLQRAGLGDEASESLLEASALARLAIEFAYEPGAAPREALSTDALALARRTGDPAALSAALSARRVTAWGPDGCAERLRLAGEMLALAEQAGDRELALQARNWRVVDLLELGDGRSVRQELDAYAELSVQARLPAFAWYVPMWRATLALLEGRIAEGHELSGRARDLGRQAGDANAEVFFAEQVLLRMVVQGRIRDLDPIDAGAELEVAERAHAGPAWRAYRFTFAWWHAERGELDQAREDFEAAVADGLSTLSRDVNWLAALTSATGACVLLEDAARARAPGVARALLHAHGGHGSRCLARRVRGLSDRAPCGGLRRPLDGRSDVRRGEGARRAGRRSRLCAPRFEGSRERPARGRP
jgi:hypothetical protein